LLNARDYHPDSKAILSSGDSHEDKAALKDSVAKYDRMHRWVVMTDGSEILNIGADNYPFPIPLVRDSSSNWYFDTGAGADELLARRIGRNEIMALTLARLSPTQKRFIPSSPTMEIPKAFTALKSSALRGNRTDFTGRSLETRNQARSAEWRILPKTRS
jgi:hypothetical protein